jgi:hypothetical protein
MHCKAGESCKVCEGQWLQGWTCVDPWGCALGHCQLLQGYWQAVLLCRGWVPNEELPQCCQG